MNENNNPPIVPDANGNQKDSLSNPIIKGIKPKMVEIIVSNIGIILLFHAFK